MLHGSEFRLNKTQNRRNNEKSTIFNQNLTVSGKKLGYAEILKRNTLNSGGFGMLLNQFPNFGIIPEIREC